MFDRLYGGTSAGTLAALGTDISGYATNMTLTSNRLVENPSRLGATFNERRTVVLRVEINEDTPESILWEWDKNSVNDSISLIGEEIVVSWGEGVESCDVLTSFATGGIYTIAWAMEPDPLQRDDMVSHVYCWNETAGLYRQHSWVHEDPSPIVTNIMYWSHSLLAGEDIWHDVGLHRLPWSSVKVRENYVLGSAASTPTIPPVLPEVAQGMFAGPHWLMAMRNAQARAGTFLNSVQVHGKGDAADASTPRDDDEHRGWIRYVTVPPHVVAFRPRLYVVKNTAEPITLTLRIGETPFEVSETITATGWVSFDQLAVIHQGDQLLRVASDTYSDTHTWRIRSLILDPVL